MPEKKNVFMQILDVVLPVVIYYFATGILLYVLNLIAQSYFVSQGDSGIRFLFDNAAAISAVNNGIGMLFAAVLILRQFIRETAYQGQVVVIKLRKAIAPAWRNGIGRMRKLGRGIWLPVLLSICACIFLNLLIGGITAQLGVGEYETVSLRQYSVSPILAIVLYGVISPLAEEMIYRGILLSKLSRYINPLVGLIGSSLVFGLLHGNLVQGSYAVIMGFVLGLSYIVYNAFGVPLICHSVSNLVIYFLTIFGGALNQDVIKLPLFIVCGFLSGFLLVRMKNRML